MKKTSQQQSKLYLILLAILAIAIIGESLFIINRFKNKGSLPIKPFSTAKLGFHEGVLKIVAIDEQNAQVVFDSNNESLSGADVIIVFDPKLISITDIQANPKIFQQTIINKNQIDEGRIKIISYLPKEKIISEQVLAEFSFKRLKNQATIIDLEFLGVDRISDSNLVSQTSQKDILGDIIALELK